MRFGTHSPKSDWPHSFSVPKSQRFKSQRLQDAHATKLQTLAFCESHRFSATKTMSASIAIFIYRSVPAEIRDDFGVSLGGRQAPLSFWKAAGFPKTFP